MLDRGIRVGLGTDGPASNDGLDLLADLRLAAALARLAGAVGDRADRRRGVLAGHRRRRPTRSAGRTWGSSRPAGAPTSCTSTPATWSFEPVGDPADLLAHLVWSGDGRHVRDVWVGGGRSSPTAPRRRVDAEALRADVADRAARLAAG